MRILTGILVLLTLVVGIFFGYCYTGAQMRIESTAVTVTPATEALGTYESIRDNLANGSFYGEIFYETDLIMAESFEFLTISVRMANRGLFPMEWIRIEVTPDVADVVQLPADRTPSLASNSRADFSATVLTRAGANTNRKITVTYYVLGAEMSATYTMGAQ